MGEDNTHPLSGLREGEEEALNRNFPGGVELAVAAAFDKFDDIIVVLMLDNFGEDSPIAPLAFDIGLDLLVLILQMMISSVPFPP